MGIFIITSGLLAVSIILMLIGSVIKYRTGISNELIALVVTGLSFLIWCLIGAWQSYALFPGDGFWYEVIFGHGVAYGISCAAMSIWGWDVFHGIHRYRKDRRLPAVDREKERIGI